MESDPGPVDVEVLQRPPAKPSRWLAALAFVGVGGFLLVDAFSARHLEPPKGQAFWGAIYVWAGVVWAIVLWRKRAAAPLPALAAVGLSAIGYVPGAALMWYSLWAMDQTRSGTCRTSTGTTTSCVTGPGALVPWAVILLLAAAGVTFVSWRRARRRSTGHEGTGEMAPRP